MNKQKNNKNIIISQIFRDNQGVAALFTVVIIMAASLIMAYTASLLSLGELEMGYDSQKGSEAFSLADGCVEEALRKLKINNSYAGETLSLGNGSCIIAVSGSGSSRTIVSTGTVGPYHKKIRAEVLIEGYNLSITSWEELSS